jgi:hypothetical protein
VAPATTEKVLRVATWAAVLLACVTLALVARGRSMTCLALVETPVPSSATSTLPVVATPGARRDHSTSSADHAWDQELGPFRLDCTTSYDGHYWDYDHCAVEVPACASRPFPFDRYGMVASSLELHQTTDGTYVLGKANEAPYVAFRAEPTGRPVGIEPLLAALLAFGLSLAALLQVRARRLQAARLAGWRGGIVERGGVIRPDDGGSPLPLASTGLEPMTSALYAPPASADDYRTAPEGVIAVSRDEVTRVDTARKKRAVVFVIASMLASIAVVGVLVLGGR